MFFINKIKFFLYKLRCFDPGLSKCKESTRALVSGVLGLVLYWLISSYGFNQFSAIAGYVVCFITVLNTQMGWNMADPGQKWKSFWLTIIGSVVSIVISVYAVQWSLAIQGVMVLFSFLMFAVRSFGTAWNGPGLSMFIYCLLIYALKPNIDDLPIYFFAVVIAFLSVAFTNLISFLRINYKRSVIDYLNVILIDLEKPCFILQQIFRDKIAYKTGEAKLTKEFLKLHLCLLEVEQSEEAYYQKLVSHGKKIDKEVEVSELLTNVKINFIRILRSLRGANEALTRLIFKDFAHAQQYKDLLLPIVDELEYLTLSLRKKSFNEVDNSKLIKPFSQKLSQLRKTLETMPIKDNREIFPAFRFLFSMERIAFALQQILLSKTETLL